MSVAFQCLAFGAQNTGPGLHSRCCPCVSTSFPVPFHTLVLVVFKFRIPGAFGSTGVGPMLLKQLDPGQLQRVRSMAVNFLVEHVCVCVLRVIPGVHWNVQAEDYGYEYEGATVRLRDGMCSVQALVAGAAWNQRVATLPSVCRPDGRLIFTASNHAARSPLAATLGSRLLEPCGFRK